MRPANNRLQLTAGLVSDLFSLCFSLRPAAAEPERYADFFFMAIDKRHVTIYY